MTKTQGNAINCWTDFSRPVSLRCRQLFRDQPCAKFWPVTVMIVAFWLAHSRPPAAVHETFTACQRRQPDLVLQFVLLHTENLQRCALQTVPSTGWRRYDVSPMRECWKILMIWPWDASFLAQSHPKWGPLPAKTPDLDDFLPDRFDAS